MHGFCFALLRGQTKKQRVAINWIYALIATRCFIYDKKFLRICQESLGKFLLSKRLSMDFMPLCLFLRIGFFVLQN